MVKKISIAILKDTIKLIYKFWEHILRYGNTALIDKNVFD